MSSMSSKEEPQLNGNAELSPDFDDDQLPSASVVNGITHDSSPEIDVSYQKPKEVEQVYFNGDLICDHGEF